VELQRDQVARFGTQHLPSYLRRLPFADPTGAGRWNDPNTTGSVPAPSQPDELLGAGLVGVFCVVTVIVGIALGPSTVALRAAVEVAVATAALDLGLLGLPWRRLPTKMLLAFPVLLLGGVAALALSTTGMTPAYSSFFTLAFLYVGLTQARGTGPAFALFAAPLYVLSQQRWTGDIVVKLILTLALWLLISDVLAVRAERSRTKTKALIARANTDVLTGLGSRLLLSDHIERLMAQSGSATSWLLFIDLDGFKSVNDTFGHGAGDEVLVIVAERLRSTFRDTDLAARLGGDEFAVLLQDSDLAQATEVANRILSVLSGPIALSRSRIAVTASIGIIEIVAPSTAEDVLRDADVAMYEAKAAGRNQMSIYKRDMKARMTKRIELETELRDAFGADQFEVHYQPVVHMGTGDVIGAEALLRWRHPRRGLLAPGEFLAASEDIGLMTPLGDWILRQACHHASAWQSIDPARAFTIAVNLSAPEMFAPDLTTRVQQTLENTGLPGKLLVLEITERVLMANSPLVQQRLQELRHLGVRIAIDDFGTGYSSLAYLREFPVDILKIDRSFVTPLGADHQALALLRSITAIADALVFDVIVEGVETPAQVEILSELGCHIAQGFYFGRPVTAEDLGNRLAWGRGNRGAVER